MEKEALTAKMNMHHLLTAVPPGWRQVEGGEVNFCTWLKFSFFFFVPLGQRSEEADGNQSRIDEKIKRGRADYCVCQLEVMEQRTGGRIKGVWGDVVN